MFEIGILIWLVWISILIYRQGEELKKFKKEIKKEIFDIKYPVK